MKLHKCPDCGHWLDVADIVVGYAGDKDESPYPTQGSVFCAGCGVSWLFELKLVGKAA